MQQRESFRRHHEGPSCLAPNDNTLGDWTQCILRSGFATHLPPLHLFQSPSCTERRMSKQNWIEVDRIKLNVTSLAAVHEQGLEVMKIEGEEYPWVVRPAPVAPARGLLPRRAAFR